MTEPPPIIEPGDAEIASAAFADYLRREGLLAKMTEEQCAEHARTFLFGFACGTGNAVGKQRVAVTGHLLDGLLAETLRRLVDVETGRDIGPDAPR